MSIQRRSYTLADPAAPVPHASIFCAYPRCLGRVDKTITVTVARVDSGQIVAEVNQQAHACFTHLAEVARETARYGEDLLEAVR